VLLSAGSQFCYAYDSYCPQTVCSAELENNSHWKACTPAKQPYGTTYGCCPEGLTEDYYWYNPQEYPHHPPTLLVQARKDRNADTEAARYYHETMLAHAAGSTHFVVGGAQHAISPPVFGVVASWVQACVKSGEAAARRKSDDGGADGAVPPLMQLCGWPSLHPGGLFPNATVWLAEDVEYSSLYMYLVVLYTKYTGSYTNDCDVFA
jgi:hypothetical protein